MLGKSDRLLVGPRGLSSLSGVLTFGHSGQGEIFPASPIHATIASRSHFSRPAPRRDADGPEWRINNSHANRPPAHAFSARVHRYLTPGRNPVDLLEWMWPLFPYLSHFGRAAPAGCGCDGPRRSAGKGRTAFYFKNPVVRELKAGDLSKGEEGPLSTAAQKIVSAFLDRHPVYVIDDDKPPGAPSLPPKPTDLPKKPAPPKPPFPPFPR